MASRYYRRQGTHPLFDHKVMYYYRVSEDHQAISQVMVSGQSGEKGVGLVTYQKGLDQSGSFQMLLDTILEKGVPSTSKEWLAVIAEQLKPFVNPAANQAA